MFGTMFFINAILLGVGLAMDAFSVSAANALAEPKMKASKMFGIALTFGVFQGLMPMIGWVCVHTILGIFTSFQKFIPWIALALLAYIGISMIVEGTSSKKEDIKKLGFGALMVQGIATSIDALSVGFTIAELNWQAALLEAAIIAIVTFAICLVGLKIGKTVGTKLAGKALIIGGIILVLIGLEIFFTSFSWNTLTLWR